MNEKRRAFYEKLDVQMDEWSIQIDQLKARTATVTGEWVNEYRHALEAFQHKHAEALAKVKELGVAGDEAWDEVVAGMEKILAEGKAAYHSAVSKFK